MPSNLEIPDISRFSEPLEWLGGRHQAMIDLVQDWSSINSGSTNLEGLATMGAAVADAFRESGADHDVIAVEDGEEVGADGEVRPLEYGPVYRFTRRANAPRKILLTGHIDTVFPESSPFQQWRYLDDNTLNGPGVADMKGGLIVMLHALLALERSPVSDGVGWEVLVSSDEEIGSIGSGPVLAERARTATIGMTYEPALADGTLAGARKGSGNFTVVVRGRAAHAGREFDKGRNAVVALADFIRDLDALNGARKGVTLNAAMISGGTANNIVPDLAILRLNVRVQNPDDQDWVERELERLCQAANRRAGYSCRLHGRFNRPPKPLSDRNKRLFDALAACGAALDLDIRYSATGGCCEGNNLAAAGLANIDTLGVRGGKIHSSEEFVLVDSFVERARLSAALMMAFAAGDFDEILPVREGSAE